MGPDEVHSLITQQQKTFDAAAAATAFSFFLFFLFGPENCPGLKETWGGKAKKEMKGGGVERKRERKWGRGAGEEEESGKGCRSFSRVCLTLGKKIGSWG